MMRAICVALLVLPSMSVVSAQERGVLAIDELGGQYALSLSGEADAINMCGTVDCEVVATFSECLGVAYSSPTQGQGVWAWAATATETDARGTALEACKDARGPACEVLNVVCMTDSETRAEDDSDLNGAAGEIALNLDRPTRRRIQQTLQAAGFDPGEADGLFGPNTRGAIRRWQAARGAPSTGYLNEVEVEALRDGGGSPVVGALTFEQASPDSAIAVADVARRQPGEVFQDCDACPEMVVMPDGQFALGRYEVTVGEYRTFAAATGKRPVSNTYGRSWERPGFEQTEGHPVTVVSWQDAHEYLAWLRETTGQVYRLPTSEEWELGAEGSGPGCWNRGLVYGAGGLVRESMGTCAVGSYGANPLGIHDMVGNVWEWSDDCWREDCDDRLLRGGAWYQDDASRLNAEAFQPAGTREFRNDFGFRVARTVD